MADLNTLEEKLAEVLGLAQAAQTTSDAGEESIDTLLGWAKPIQQRHFETVQDCALTLAAAEDPYEEE